MIQQWIKKNRVVAGAIAVPFVPIILVLLLCFTLCGGFSTSAQQITGNYFSTEEGARYLEDIYLPVQEQIEIDYNLLIPFHVMAAPYMFFSKEPTIESVEIWAEEVAEVSEDGTLASYETIARTLKENKGFKSDLVNVTVEDLAKMFEEFELVNSSGGGAEGTTDVDIDIYTDSYAAPLNPFAVSGWTGQCTWFVWGRVHQVLGIEELPTGNARDWIAEARELGYETGLKPEVHAVAVWGGTYQHVAFVEAYEDGNVTLSEGNYWDTPGQSLPQWSTLAQAKQHLHEVTLTEENVKNRSSNPIFLGYIYLERGR